MRAKKDKPVPTHHIAQNGELYDVDDFRLAIGELNRLGYDLHSVHSHGNVHRLNLTCQKTRNRFILECIGHNDWPDAPSAP